MRLALVMGAAVAVLLTGGHAANASSRPASASTAGTGAYCPDRAPLHGAYLRTVVTSDGHHRDVYLRPTRPLQPVNIVVVDCDS
jgi:hypothetical protein